MKAKSNLFGTSIDDLISDEDIENKKALDEKWQKDFIVRQSNFWA